jgi:pimeloyl-ACP methyl ester carboxylesterase
MGVIDAIAWAALVVVLFVAGATLYVMGSYVLAHRHAPRGVGATLRDAFRELVWTIAIQPLLPIYWLFGRRMGTLLGGPISEGRRPVVFVHGYAQNRVDFLRVARTLRRRGFGDLFGFNYPWLSSLQANAQRLQRFVASVCEECRAERVDLVCHSMGGLVAMQFLLTEEGARRVSRCVTIATPWKGVRWRGPILGGASNALRRGFEFPDGPPSTSTRLLSIYSRHDNVVHPAETSSLVHRGGRDHDAGTMGHLAILFDPAVADAVADFLEEVDPPARIEVSVEQVDAAAREAEEASEVDEPEDRHRRRLGS